MGKDNVRPDELQRINKLLQHESKEVIISDSKLAPNWIAEILLNSLKNKTDE